MPEGVRSPYPMIVEWEGEKRFRGRIPDGPSLVVDGSRTVAPGPVDALLVSIGACSAIDVVEYLQKRRTPAESLSVRLDFSRAPSPPRRLTAVNAHYTVVTASDAHHVERAVSLSFEKYCSVINSLKPDTELSWSVEVIPAKGNEVAD